MVADAPADERAARLVSERGMSEADARARIANQVDDAERRAIADVVIDTSGALEDTIRGADALSSAGHGTEGEHERQIRSARARRCRPRNRAYLDSDIRNRLVVPRQRCAAVDHQHTRSTGREQPLADRSRLRATRYVSRSIVASAPGIG